jgi:C4-dicarboxylate-specific signal transduction histidine kinase
LRDTALCYRFKALIKKNNIQQAITYYERAGIKLTLSTLYDLTFNNHERSNQAAHPPLLYDSKSQPVHAATKAYIIDINSASIAHQLAQPLTAITAQIETLLIQKKQQKEESTVAILERAKHSLLEMGELIHRLKNQTKTQENILSHAFLSQRLKKIVKLYEGDLITFTLTIEPALKKHPIELDWLYFEQCLAILINNSLEAGSPEEIPHVFIQCYYQDNYLHIICHDQGPGIPEAIRPLLFKTPYTSKENGMGIGLSLANMMLQKAKGDIKLINKSPGAHFHIKMPMDLRK